jgi:hypothetical protein
VTEATAPPVEAPATVEAPAAPEATTPTEAAPAAASTETSGTEA